MRIHLLFAIALMFISVDAISQSVGISTAVIVPDPDAILELDATDKGLLVPRMNSTQRSNYTTNANSGGGLGASEAGMTIYNTSTNLYNYWDGAAWVVIQTVGGTTGAYIDNQNALDQAADFRIAGDGTVKGALGVGTQAALATSRLLVHDASATAGELQLLVRDNASLPILAVEDIGRVGIGTSSPGAALEIRGVAGGPTFSERITKESNIANELIGIGFGSQQASSVVKSGIVHERISANGTGKLHFLNDNSVDANDVATTETRMTIDQNGNLGLGTTSPSQHLHVISPSNGDLTWDEGIHIENTGTTAGEAALSFSNIATGTNYWMTGLNQSNDYDISYGSTFTNANTVMRILDNGNVGIGNTGPTQKLHVTGNGRFTTLGGGGTRNLTVNNNGDLVAGSTSVGDITGVTAGDGLTGGGTSGTVTLNVVATNGLTDAANDIRLGGTLVQATTITQGANSMNFNLNSTGDFNVQDAGTTHFQVADNGLTFFGDDTYWRDGSVTGTNLMILNDDGDDGRLRIYENGTTSVDLDANTQFIFNEQGLDRDFRVESDGNANMFRVDASVNRIGIGTGSPTAALEVYGSSYEIEISNTSETDAGIIFNDAQATGSQYAEITYNCGSGNDLSFRNGSATPRMVIESNGEVGIGTANPTYRLHVSGRLKTTGINETSDVRLKKDVGPIENALEDILQMKGVTYNWKKNEYPDMGLEGGLQHGLIAQDLEKIIPELVLTDNDGWKSIEYSHLVPVLIEALKEQNQIIEGQASDISDLKSQASITQKQLQELIDQVNGVSLAE